VSNMNKQTHDKLYPIIVERDGDICHSCGRLHYLKPLVLDHIDNDNSNNEPNNLQILCKSCNKKKDSLKKETLDMCVRKVYSKNDSLTINREKEPRFRRYVYERLDFKGDVEVDEMVYGIAEEISISPETAKRYLRKMCSSSGKLEEYKPFPGLHRTKEKSKKRVRYKEEFRLVSFEKLSQMETFCS